MNRLNMNLLAIDTSSKGSSVALKIGNKTYSIEDESSQKQAQSILFLIDRLLKEASARLEELGGLAFGCGPGSFTGIRIATSVVQGLGFALNLPVIPISSLAALAQTIYLEQGWDKLIVGTDARMHEVYWGIYKIQNGFAELSRPEEVCKPYEFNFPQDPSWYGVGDAWEAYKDSISYQPKDIASRTTVKAAAVLDLAQQKLEKNEWIHAQDAVPTYLRNKVAKKITEQGSSF